MPRFNSATDPKGSAFIYNGGMRVGVHVSGCMPCGHPDAVCTAVRKPLCPTMRCATCGQEALFHLEMCGGRCA